MRAMLTALLVAPMLSGCLFFFYIPAGVHADSAFHAFVREHEDKPSPKAFAVARGASLWTWGGAWGYPSQDAANQAALARCEKARAERAIVEPCVLHQVE